MTELKTLIELNPKVGDVVIYVRSRREYEYTIEKIEDSIYLSTEGWVLDEKQKSWKIKQESTATTTKTGGPASYYDYPFKNWVTVNDMIDHLSQKQWGWRSYIFKDILKACFRWGQKEGTTEIYDAEKIVYYGVRLLLSVSDIKTVRKYLQTILDDEQFKGNENV